MKIKKIKKASISIILLELFLYTGNKASAKTMPLYGVPDPEPSEIVLGWLPWVLVVVLPLAIIIGAIVCIVKKIRKKQNAEEISKNRDGSDPNVLSK